MFDENLDINVFLVSTFNGKNDWEMGEEQRSIEGWAVKLWNVGTMEYYSLTLEHSQKGIPDLDGSTEETPMCQTTTFWDGFGPIICLYLVVFFFLLRDTHCPHQEN